MPCLEIWTLFWKWWLPLNIYLLIFREGGGKKRGRETSMFKRYMGQFSLTCPQLGAWPTTQACVPTGNWTSNLSVRRPVLNLLSHTSQGWIFFFKWEKVIDSDFHLRKIILAALWKWIGMGETWRQQGPFKWKTAFSGDRNTLLLIISS